MTEVQILQAKMMELQSALLYNESDSILKLPTQVILEVELDTDGHIWFVIPRPAQQIQAFDKEFPARLEFFRKGKDYFLKVTGIASLMTDAVEKIADNGLSAEMLTKMQNVNLMGVKLVAYGFDLDGKID